MQLANIAARLMKPFANSGNKAAIPQTGTDPARASYETGFTPLNMTPIAAGGVPPSGRDMNGILYDLSNAMMWQQAMGILPYDATVSYPNGALVVYGGMMWKCLADDTLNVTPVNGAKWTSDIHTGYVKKTGDTMTGPLTAPTATVGTNTTQVATTAFVQLSSPASLADNGYQKLPSGLIIQWGGGTTNSSGNYQSALPIAFPTGHIRGLATTQGETNPGLCISVFSLNATMIDVRVRTLSGAASTIPVSWIAIGY